MRKVVAAPFVSLDGLMAGPNGELAWNEPYFDEEMAGYLHDHFSTLDTLVLATWDIRSNERPVVSHDGSFLAKAHEMGLQSIGSMLHVHSDHAPISKRRGSVCAPCVFLDQATSLLLLSCAPGTGFA